MTSSSWQDWTARLRAYVGWLNSQLRKEDGGRRVSDLRNDLRDGVILAHLVESLGSDTVPGINTEPRTENQAKENVDRLFRFLIRKGVPIHSLTPKEICDGDLKAIMRLVHAVASHYKPDTVLNPPRSNYRKDDGRPLKKSCKVAPLQNSSNLEPQRLNSKSVSSSLDLGYRLSENFIEQLINDVRQTKIQLLLLQEAMRGDRKSFPEPETESLAEENIRLQNIIEEKEQEISRLKLALSAQENTVNYVPPRIQREELQVVGEALGSLRRCFPANDARQHTLDTIDQSLAALLERINAIDTHSQVQNAIVRRSQHLRDSGSNLMRTFQDDVSNGSTLEDSNSTKVVYYMEKSLTPFRCILHKRIGEATLRDFKLLFDRPGQYRYHFKTLDREFGMVKEEVSFFFLVAVISTVSHGPIPVFLLREQCLLR
ncbi:hypothetical protein JTE90_005783 [Oedothorax gibbosus]|uniref:Dixin n=1 Tax=Oedothorax gibbosus TaxID=931172 RepID=A0AAV6UTA2_9ARAC|nr:hypothetical protein JTE90_005783 [Oedothorax gibbosus]